MDARRASCVLHQRHGRFAGLARVSCAVCDWWVAQSALPSVDDGRGSDLWVCDGVFSSRKLARINRLGQCPVLTPAVAAFAASGLPTSSSAECALPRAKSTAKTPVELREDSQSKDPLPAGLFQVHASANSAPVPHLSLRPPHVKCDSSAKSPRRFLNTGNLMGNTQIR